MKLSKKLILASNSPRRKDIMQMAGFDFEVIVKPTDETFSEEMNLYEVPGFLAKTKAQCFEDSNPDDLVLCADTVVILENKILNKPENLDQARKMLESLSGKTHEVATAVCLKIGKEYLVKTDIVKVTFKDLSHPEIEYYLKNHAPLDKAGAYGVQEFIGMIGIPEIKGSFYTVMGLPIHLVYQLLTPYLTWN